jgi:transposase
MTTLESRTKLRPSAALNLVVPGGSVATEPRSLAHAVQAAVRSVDEARLRPVARRDAGLALQPKALLALLSYCYARQIYASEEIEDVVRRDESCRQLCHNEFPDEWVIRSYRRHNRGAIQFCLMTALCFMAEEKVRQGIVTKVNKGHLAEEANRRITMAMFIDSMTLDGD